LPDPLAGFFEGEKWGREKEGKGREGANVILPGAKEEGVYSD